MAVRHIPEGYPTVSPYLVVTDVPAVIDFAERVLDGQVVERMEGPDGEVSHAEVRVGDSLLMLGPAQDESNRMPAMLHIYVPDVDAVYQRALDAGATSVREPADQFYGDRSGGVTDAEGNTWWFATHIEDLSPEEVARRATQEGGS